MEVSFSKEVKALRLGAGDTFHGEGILAITKALLQSGVAYVGGYQGAPVSHLLDVMVQAEPYMRELGVHVEACSNEASAAAMLGASIHYPLRGAVTWKSIVGTNVAADALSNLSSPGVKGGALIVVGEDYGEGASVIQERTHAYALKSSLLMLDPRPELGNMVRMVEAGFALSEASNMPAIMELRIRACHVRGSFVCKDNVAPALSTKALIAEPAAFDYARLAHPPVTFGHEKLKVAHRIPAAREFIKANKLNEFFDGKHADVGPDRAGRPAQHADPRPAAVAPGRCVRRERRADPGAERDVPAGARRDHRTSASANVRCWCWKKARQSTSSTTSWRPCADRTSRPRLHGKDMLQAAGEYNVELITSGLAKFVADYLPQLSTTDATDWLAGNTQRRADVAQQLGGPLPARPPGFCIGCPERPVFAALKLAQQDVGPVHISADIGCHALATFEPFSIRPLDPGLRHEPGQQRRRVADDEAARAGHHGRRRLLAQRVADGRAVLAVQRRRLGAADHEERLHLGHRHAGHHLHAR